MDDSEQAQLASSHIEVRTSPKGGLGVFATAPIAAGTRLLAEEPLLAVDCSNYMESDVERAVATLSASARKCFMSLASAHGQAAEQWPRAIHPRVSAAERARIGEQHAARMGAQATPLSVFMTNAMRWRGDGAAVFARASRINHSCLPNAHFTWNDGLGLQTVHAVIDLQPGDELTVAYCDPLDEPGRRRWECKNYGFCCDCPACAQPTPTEADDCDNFAELSARRRARLRDIRTLVGDQAFQARSALKELPAVSSTGELELRLEGAGIMVEEGLVTPVLGEMYIGIAKNCIAHGDKAFALAAAEKGHNTLTTCLGLAATQTMEAGLLLEQIQSSGEKQPSDSGH